MWLCYVSDLLLGVCSSLLCSSSGVLRSESMAYNSHVSVSVLRSICRAYTGYISTLCYARQLLAMSVVVLCMVCSALR
jgi:hypothetical protein